MLRSIVNEEILAYENLIQRIQSKDFKNSIQEIKSKRKTSHWSWWAFPTEKPGFSEPMLENNIKTKLTPETFKLFLINLPKPWINLMKEIIKKIKEGLRVIDLFPEIDHDRIKYFIMFFSKNLDKNPDLPNWKLVQDYINLLHSNFYQLTRMKKKENINRNGNKNKKGIATIILGPTSVGKTTYCNQQSKNGKLVLDIDQHPVYTTKRDEVQKEYLAKLKKEDKKWSFLAFKKFLDQEAEKILAEQVFEITQKGQDVLLPHIRVPQVWLTKLDPKIIILWKPIQQVLEQSQQRARSDSRSHQQVLNDYKSLFKPCKENTGIYAHKVSDTIPGSDKYHQYFGLKESKTISNIIPKIKESKVIIL